MSTILKKEQLSESLQKEYETFTKVNDDLFLDFLKSKGFDKINYKISKFEEEEEIMFDITFEKTFKKNEDAEEIEFTSTYFPSPKVYRENNIMVTLSKTFVFVFIDEYLKDKYGLELCEIEKRNYPTLEEKLRTVLSAYKYYFMEDKILIDVIENNNWEGLLDYNTSPW